MNTSLTARQLIELLKLEPLEGEGGLFRATYSSRHKLGDAAAGSAIYYLLTPNTFSHFHRLTGDEVYHFYLGDPVELCELLPDGSGRITVLGQNLANGYQVQHLVPEGTWQGSRLVAGGSWALMGTTMCPGYTQQGYEHGDRGWLMERYPDFSAQIAALTGPVRWE